jgi:hypothetical protein
VRLIEAPTDALTDPVALGYRTTAWGISIGKRDEVGRGELLIGRQAP